MQGVSLDSAEGCPDVGENSCSQGCCRAPLEDELTSQAGA